MMRRAWLPALVVTLLALSLTGCRTAPQTELFGVPRMAGIAVDGNANDWGENGFLIPMVTEGDGRIKAATDFDAVVRLGWNKEGLLVLVQVEDDLFTEHAELDQLWSHDSVEMFVAPRKGAQDYYQIIMSPGMDPKFPEVRSQWYDYRKTLATEEPPASTLARSGDDRRYCLEALLPWSNLKIRPKLGREIGFQISVNDFDTTLYRGLWFPKKGTYRDSNLMHRLRLTTIPSVIPPKAAAGFAQDGRPCIRVAGGGEDIVGKRVAVTDGEKLLASGEMELRMGRPFAELLLPRSVGDASSGSLTVTLDEMPIPIFTPPQPPVEE